MPRVPGVRIEGEEYGVHEGTKGAPHWVIDPVDGTTNYAHGIGWCSFSLGLASPQGVPLLGLLADPWRREIFTATRGGGAHLNGRPIRATLRRQTSRGADQIWEARPKCSRAELSPGKHEVTALDVNGAYLSALKTHLPLGQLEHSTGNHHDRRRAGVHLITPPTWEHDAYLPNPIGSRDESGPLWVTEPTLRLLLRLSGPKYGLCDPPEIHESWTSGATEILLEKFRVALKDARERAIAEEDEATLE